MRKLAIILPGAVLALLMVNHYVPAESHTQRMTTVSPTVSTPSVVAPVSVDPSTLPVCASEDGSGQALCYWDAQVQGNGLGTSLVSGDCAADYVGGKANEATCVALYGMGQNGIDYVGECVAIDNTISDNDRKNEGWDIGECFDAFNG